MVAARRRAPRGFTLIELTFAILLLAVGMLALVGALAHSLHETAAARLRHAALREAESIADSLAVVGVASAGVRFHAATRIEWRPETCPAGACVRIFATTGPEARDTLTLLARLDGEPTP